MDASLFISKRLRFKGGLVMTCIAVSYLVMIIAVSVSSGFRSEIRDGLSLLSGDIQLTPPNLNVLDQTRPIERTPSYLPHILEVEGVASVEPVIYMAGIVRQQGEIHGVIFKGTATHGTGVSIPKRLSELSGLVCGDRMTVYFVSDRVRVRQFDIVSVYESLVEADDRLVVHAGVEDMQRLNGWSENQVSAMEIMLDASHKSEVDIYETTQEIGALVNAYSEESEAPVVAVSSVSRFPQLFDWLNLIDFNVIVILLLMTVVAGFNMVSGLLIMLFENISTIGLLKALGMNDKAISKVFLISGAKLVLKGMLIGNAIAFAFTILQSATHVLKLDPANYFVSFVPVKINAGSVILADIVSFVVIMLLLLLPALFVSRVDPAKTIRMK